jgi:peroxiredoxin
MFDKIIRGLMGGKNHRTIAAGEQAPAFSLNSTDGQKRSLQDALARGPVLAAFFKVSCPVCQYTFPFVERLHKQLRLAGAKDVQIWGVVQDSASSGRGFAKEYGVTFPILVDEEPYHTSLDYGLNYVPTLFLIGAHGRVEMTGDGFSKADLLTLHKRLADHYGVKLPALFLPADRVPEYKPG